MDDIAEIFKDWFCSFQFLEERKLKPSIMAERWSKTCCTSWIFGHRMSFAHLDTLDTFKVYTTRSFRRPGEGGRRPWVNADAAPRTRK